MRQRAFHGLCVAVGLLLLGAPLLGQLGSGKDKDSNNLKTSPGTASKTGNHVAYVQDWSTRHLVMPGTRMEDVMASGKPDPRLVYNMMRHRAALQGSQSTVVPLRPKEQHPLSKVDWAVSLENGYVVPDEYPAKFSFDIDTQDCRSDFVLFGLYVNTAEPTTPISQATVVGINNLYSGASTPCNGGVPSVAFAYNTQTQPTGEIDTSPTLSADGTRVAFVETTNTGSYFHVLVLPDPLPLPTSPDGTVLSPLTPSACPSGVPNTQGCMTTLLISAHSDSISSPWIDYASDAAYVADDNGILYKIRPVFAGAPALITSNGWPVTVSASMIPILTDPVVDTNAGLIFLGDLDGYLYSVNLTSPAGTISTMQIGEGIPSGGLVDAPVVATDPANLTNIDQVFAFTGCSNLTNYGAAVTQVPANFSNSTTTTTLNTVNLTVSRSTGMGTCITTPANSGNIHAGAFDNAFYMSGSTSGHLIACGYNSHGGNASEPRIYMLPFVGNTISTWIASYKPDTTAGDECSPLTEFYNNGTDSLFYGVGNAYTSDPTPDGFVESATINTISFTPPTACTTSAPTSSCVTAPPAIEGVSGIIIDNDLSNGGSNIYFTTENPGSVNGGNCSVSGGLANPYCAVQLSQSDF
jgi:hypothetical protein